jgi:hypothetical protein
LVPAGTPDKRNGGDFGSKHDAVPSHDKSTVKLDDCACSELPHVSTNKAKIAAILIGICDGQRSSNMTPSLCSSARRGRSQISFANGAAFVAVASS